MIQNGLFKKGNTDSNRDSADQPYTGDSGSSKFLAFPIATSVFDSKSHIFVATVTTLIAICVTRYFGFQSVIWVVSVTLLYTLGLTAFRFGELPNFTASMDEYPFLIAISGLLMSVTVTMIYTLLETSSSFLTTTLAGAAVVGTWFVNRRLYVTLKEDLVLHGYATSHSWLYLSRIPFVAVLATSVVASVSALLWVGLMGYCTAVSFSYGIIRVMEPEPSQESTWEEEWNPSTSATPRGTRDTTASQPETGDSVDDSTTKAPDNPEKALDNYEKAKELTKGLRDAVEAVNTELENEGLTKYELPSVSGNTIPPDLENAKEIHEKASELNDYLLRYDEDNRALRRRVLEVQQHVQEIDEFIYTDIEAPVYR